MAETIRIPADKVKTAEGKQTMFGKLHGILDWKMDEFIIPWESGKKNEQLPLHYNPRHVSEVCSMGLTLEKHA